MLGQHAAFFGEWRYAAGLLTVYGWGRADQRLAVAGAAGALVGFATSFLVVRGADLARLAGDLDDVGEAVNKAAFVTGGVDGLSGVTMWWFPLRSCRATRRICTAATLFAVFVAVRRIVNSPFGLSLRGIRENGKRKAGHWRAGHAPVDQRLHHQVAA